MTDQQNEYFEQVNTSGRVFAFLGLLLGATAGALTGVAIKGLIGDPVVSGGEAFAFYAAFGASSLITLFVMLNYLMMGLRVSEDGLEIKIGMKSASVERGELVAVRVAGTMSRMSRAMGKDGRGISQMWTVLGVGSGIEIDISRGGGNDGHSGKAQTWFVASRDPEKLCEKLESLIGNSPGGGTESRPAESG